MLRMRVGKPLKYFVNINCRLVRLVLLDYKLNSLKKDDGEDLTDYMLRAKTAAYMLKKAGEIFCYRYHST